MPPTQPPIRTTGRPSPTTTPATSPKPQPASDSPPSKATPSRSTSSAPCTTRVQGLPQDDAEAAYWERKAAEQGHAYAQANLSFRYYAAEQLRRSLRMVPARCAQQPRLGAVQPRPHVSQRGRGRAKQHRSCLLVSPGRHPELSRSPAEASRPLLHGPGRPAQLHAGRRVVSQGR